MAKIEQKFGIFAESWDLFNAWLDRREKGSVNETDYLTITIPKVGTKTFKNRKDIEHKDYPANDECYYIYFKDIPKEKK